MPMKGFKGIRARWRRNPVNRRTQGAPQTETVPTLWERLLAVPTHWAYVPRYLRRNSKRVGGEGGSRQLMTHALDQQAEAALWPLAKHTSDAKVVANLSSNLAFQLAAITHLRLHAPF